MMTLSAITKFFVPRFAVEETDRQLRAGGETGLERFVLWTGTREQANFVVRTVHTPGQTGLRLPSGICVRVDGEELHRLNVWLYENREQLAIQIHSHPTDAYHSETDDTYPIVTMEGGISVVVPDFGRRGIRGNGVAFYRLFRSKWEELSYRDIRRLFHFER